MKALVVLTLAVASCALPDYYKLDESSPVSIALCKQAECRATCDMQFKVCACADSCYVAPYGSRHVLCPCELCDH